MGSCLRLKTNQLYVIFRVKTFWCDFSAKTSLHIYSIMWIMMCCSNVTSEPFYNHRTRKFNQWQDFAPLSVLFFCVCEFPVGVKSLLFPGLCLAVLVILYCDFHLSFLCLCVNFSFMEIPTLGEGINIPVTGVHVKTGQWAICWLVAV